MTGNNENSGVFGPWVEQFEKRFDQRFTDFGRGIDLRFIGVDDAAAVALTGTKEALKIESETRNTALIAAKLEAGAALVIERQATKDKFETLNDSVKRMEGIVGTMIPRGEVNAKLDSQADLIKKLELAIGERSAAGKGMLQLWTILGGAIIISATILGLLMHHG